MSGPDISIPVGLKGAFQQSLAALVESLDREHYPGSLLRLLERAVLNDSAPRSLSLLALALDGKKALSPQSPRLLAAELLLKGYLLQADFVFPVGETAGGGLAGQLRTEFTPAQVLLAADTLFTLPFEILAASPEETERRALTRFSERFGPEGVLGRLDSAGGSFEEFLVLDPLGPLVEAVLGEEYPVDETISALTRLGWLREAAAWFGEGDRISALIRGTVRTLESRRDGFPPGESGIYEYLMKH